MKIRNVLISQPRPESEKSPYFDIARNYKVNLEFKQFIKVEGLSAIEFRKQRIDLSQYSCIILNSRNAVDHYFRIANELRFTVPEKNKYFCLTEAVALYLQKYIVYRKRKIFFAQQSIEELAEPIRKNKEEKFLFPCSDKHSDKITEFLDQNKINYTKGIFYKTVSNDMSSVKIKDFDLILFFSPHGVQSLFDNFPDYQQGEQKIGVFGVITYQAALAKGLRVDLVAPMPHAPSMTMALEWFIRETNKNGECPKPFIPVIPAESPKEPVISDNTEQSKPTSRNKTKSVSNAVKTESAKTKKKTTKKVKSAQSAVNKTPATKSAKKKVAPKGTIVDEKVNAQTTSETTKPVKKSANSSKKAKPAVKKEKKTKPLVKKKVASKAASKKKSVSKAESKKSAAKKSVKAKKTNKKAVKKKK
jgi:uroporphyrinogen-III synthase